MLRPATLNAQTLGLGLVLAAGGPALADDGSLIPRAGSWFTQNGPIIVNFRDKSEVKVNGTVADGVEANPKDNVTMSNSIGYNFTPNISAQLVLGVTPDTDVINQDGVKLGEVTYGAPSLLADYRFTQFGAIQPFVGVGVMYLFFNDEKDGALSNLEVDDTFGFILRTGAEYMIDSRLGIYLAANKVFIEADVTSNIGANKVEAELELDPWIFQTGITYRF